MQARVGVLALTVLLSAACGDIVEVASDAAPAPDAAAPPDAAPPPGPCDPGGEPTVEEGYQCLTYAGCALISRCLPIVTVEDCVLMDVRLFDVRAFIHRAIVREATEEGVIAFHPDEVAGCYTTLTEMSCAELIERQGFDELSVERICPAVFTGTVPMDGTCFTALDCEAPGSVCRLSPDCGAEDFCCPGTCVLPAALDGSCDANPCSPGDYCVSGICRSGEPSAPCSTTADCDLGLWCNDGSCAAELESGAACTQLEECPGPEVCLVPPGAEGGTCARVDQADAPCNDSCYGFVCVQPDPAALGTCEPLLDEEGADCADFPCSAAYECSQATDQCDPRGDVGDFCSSDEGNRCRGGIGDGGLFCDSEISGEPTGQCSAPMADGESCTRNDQCQSGVCAGDPETCLPYPGCYE
jgi:hypothetical protein